MLFRYTKFVFVFSSFFNNQKIRMCIFCVWTIVLWQFIWKFVALYRDEQTMWALWQNIGLNWPNKCSDKHCDHCIFLGDSSNFDWFQSISKLSINQKLNTHNTLQSSKLTYKNPMTDFVNKWDMAHKTTKNEFKKNYIKCNEKCVHRIHNQ